MMIVKVLKKGGSLDYMASLHLGLALLALLTVPVTLYLLSKALSFEVEVNVLAVALLAPAGLFTQQVPLPKTAKSGAGGY